MDGVIKKPKVKLRFDGKNSFRYAAAVLWNDLPDDFRKNSNFNQFKNILKSWNGNVNVQFVLTFKLFKFLPSRSYPVFIYCALYVL
jgi:hypothetical protein